MGKHPGEPPSAALPDSPDYTIPRLVPSSSEGVHPSTSYGDTRNLLDITQRTGWAQKPSSLVNSEYQQSRHFESFVPPVQTPAKARRNSNNPYNVDSSPQVMVSHASSDHFIFDDNSNFAQIRDNRQPLERDVSEALRRASRFSVYSNGSVSSSILHQTGIFQSEASGFVGAGMVRSLTFADTPHSAAEITGEDKDNSLPAEDSTFYANGALAQNWLDNHRRNLVRVPITHNGALPDSPPDSSLSDMDQQSDPVARKGSGEEVDDWETVGESAFGLDKHAYRNTTGMLDGLVRRAGSSLANVSDDGSEKTASPHIPSINEFGSTDRITQHPGRIEYSGDYRQRDLKKTNQPVFLPVFREHKVNGYLADSSRIRSPPNPFNFHPKPLARTHTNPFASSPPEVMVVRGNKKPGACLHVRAPAAQSPYRCSTDNTSMETDITEHNAITVPDTKLAPLPVPEITRTYDWMDSFGEPGPAIGRQDQTLQQPRQFLRVETPDRPSSWQHVMTFANSQEVPGYNLDGSRVLDRTFNNKSPFSNNAIPDRDGFVQAPTYGGVRNATTHHACSPFAKSPAEAVQRGERNKSNVSEGERRARILTRYNNPKPNHAKDTTRLRPLSLVKAHLPTTPITPAGRDPHEDIRPHDFVYRSPLASPRDPDWRSLYAQPHLDRIDDFARAYGVYDLQPGEPRQNSRRHLHEAPRLVPRSQQSSELPRELVDRRRKISITVLALCNLFPPVLILYALGQMDGIMQWWTSGDIPSFGKGQKRAAYFLIGVWGAIVVFSLIIFLIYSRHH